MRIIKEYALETNRTTKPITLKIKEMSTAPVPAVYNRTEQAVMPKSIVPDPRWSKRD